jgi:5'-nucleotidase
MTEDLPRVVVTNDDGVESPGLRKLAVALSSEYDVVLAAPDSDMSGSGTGIGRFDPDKGVSLDPIELDGMVAFGIPGPPGLAVMAAALGAFGRFPDLVVSGINAGINTGHSIIHSGTVGAVLTALTFRSKGLAVSLAQSEPWQWDTAVDVALSSARWVLARTGPYALNVNVPGVPIDEVAGIHWADLDEFGSIRVANNAVSERKVQFVLGHGAAGADPASDTALCARNYVTMTPISTVEPVPFPDVEATSVWSR